MLYRRYLHLLLSPSIPGSDNVSNQGLQTEGTHKLLTPSLFIVIDNSFAKYSLIKFTVFYPCMICNYVTKSSQSFHKNNSITNIVKVESYRSKRLVTRRSTHAADSFSTILCVYKYELSVSLSTFEIREDKTNQKQSS